MSTNRIKDLQEFNEKHPHIASIAPGETSNIMSVVSARYNATMPYDKQLLLNMHILKAQIINNK